MEVTSFNASIEINELMMRTLAGVSKGLVVRCVEELSKIYGFSNEDALSHLSLDTMKSNVKSMAKRTAKEPKQKPVKSPKETKSKPKSKIPMPFSSVDCSAAGCHGIKFNHGLFTQCPSDKLATGDYCRTCQTEADENSSGAPICGTIKDSMEQDLMEYDKDTKGRKPVHYLSVLRKLKISAEEAQEEAGKLNYNINNVHLVEPEQKNSKGRPKKPETIVEAAEDLFAAIATAPVATSKSSKPKLSEEEKAEKEALLQQQREAKKQELEAKKLAEKAEKEAARLAEKAEKEAAKIAEKEAKEAAKLAEKTQKLQEKFQKEVAKIADKTKSSKSSSPVSKSASPVAKAASPVAKAASPVAKATSPVAAEEAPKTKVKVGKVNIDGIVYLVSADGNAYDEKTKLPVGTYDKVTRKLTPLLDDSDEEEEEEEEYDM